MRAFASISTCDRFSATFKFKIQTQKCFPRTPTSDTVTIIQLTTKQILPKTIFPQQISQGTNYPNLSISPMCSTKYRIATLSVTHSKHVHYALKMRVHRIKLPNKLNAVGFGRLLHYFATRCSFVIAVVQYGFQVGWRACSPETRIWGHPGGGMLNSHRLIVCIIFFYSAQGWSTTMGQINVSVWSGIECCSSSEQVHLLTF